MTLKNYFPTSKKVQKSSDKLQKEELSSPPNPLQNSNLQQANTIEATEIADSKKVK